MDFLGNPSLIPSILVICPITGWFRFDFRSYETGRQGTHCGHHDSHLLQLFKATARVEPQDHFLRKKPGKWNSGECLFKMDQNGGKHPKWGTWPSWSYHFLKLLTIHWSRSLTVDMIKIHGEFEKSKGQISHHNTGGIVPQSLYFLRFWSILLMKSSNSFPKFGHF